jgi:hypothetical protein
MGGCRQGPVADWSRDAIPRDICSDHQRRRHRDADREPSARSRAGRGSCDDGGKGRHLRAIGFSGSCESFPKIAIVAPVAERHR